MQDVLETRKKQIEHKCELLSVAKKSVLQLLCVCFSLPNSVCSCHAKEGGGRGDAGHLEELRGAQNSRATAGAAKKAG